MAASLAPVPPRVRARLLTAGLAVALVVALTVGITHLAFAASLFGDDFEDGNTSGWSKSGGTWSVVADGSQVLRQSKADTDNARLFAGTTSWTDYRMQARVKPLSIASDGLVGVLARSSGSTTFYRLAVLPDQFQLQVVRSGAVTVIASASRTVSMGTWYSLAIEVSGTTLRGYVDNTLIGSGTSTAVAAGRIGVQTSFATTNIDDVLVSTIGSTPPSTTASTSRPPTTVPPTSTPPITPPTTRPPTTPPPAGSIVVAKDGSGNFTTVQAAVNAVAANNTSRATIVIKPGMYRELVSIPSNKPFISFIGQTGVASDVVITYDNASGTTKPGGGTYGTSGSASVTVDGHDFIARNLTFSNTFDEAGHPEISDKQAVAILTRTDRLVFDNVRFLGNQDTLYHNSASTSTLGRAYFKSCYVEGDVDFIFGRGTAVFDQCEIRSLNRNSSSNNGYVTAASTDISNPHGYLFYRCNLTSPAVANSVYLGRPWHPSGDVNAIAQVVYRESTLGAHIKSSPWTDMSGFSWKDARFSEYHNTGAGSTVTADRPQLTDAQAASMTPQAYLAGSDGWNPIS
jgi:pectin methylesterase-like acyl-CoA thioesterase